MTLGWVGLGWVDRFQLTLEKRPSVEKGDFVDMEADAGFRHEGDRYG